MIHYPKMIKIYKKYIEKNKIQLSYSYKNGRVNDRLAKELHQYLQKLYGKDEIYNSNQLEYYMEINDYNKVEEIYNEPFIKLQEDMNNVLFLMKLKKIRKRI